MAGITDEQKREKLRNWRPDWNSDTIGEWSGAQLEKIYRKEQQTIVQEIELNLGIKDYRGLSS